MEFFKQNEEVIDLVLTPKGRQLLSEGKFKPAGYSFHDIDVRYEDNSGEAQNAIANRIKNTVRLKTPTFFSGSAFYLDGKTGKVVKKHNLADQIGDKILGNQYAPAWKLSFLSAPDFQNYYANGTLITSKFYNTYLTANTFSNIIENEGLEEIIPQLNVNSYFQLVDAINFIGPDGKKYVKTFLVEERDLLVNVEEINSFEENEINNYNFEVYLEADEGKDKGNLIQLLFNKEIPDKFSVENYLNISFDNNADFEEQIKTADIYGPGGKDSPTSCD